MKLMELLSEEDLQMLYQIGLIAKRDMELAPSLSGGFDMALLRICLLYTSPSPRD